jgi:hypothetical protein
VPRLLHLFIYLFIFPFFTDYSVSLIVCPHQRANGDIARAIEEWSKIQGSWQEPPSKPPTSVNQPAGGAANPHVPVGLTQDLLTSALQQAAGGAPAYAASRRSAPLLNKINIF